MNKENDEFVLVEEDLPLDDPSFEYLSVAVDLLLIDGTIVENCFYHNEVDEWFRISGRKVSKKLVKGWRSCG